MGTTGTRGRLGLCEESWIQPESRAQRRRKDVWSLPRRTEVAAEEGPLWARSERGEAPEGVTACGISEWPRGQTHGRSRACGQRHPREGEFGGKEPGAGGGVTVMRATGEGWQVPQAEAGFIWRWGRTTAGVGRWEGGTPATWLQWPPGPPEAVPRLLSRAPQIPGSCPLQPREASPGEVPAGIGGNSVPPAP